MISYKDAVIEYIASHCTQEESMGLLKMVFTTNSTNRLSAVCGVDNRQALLETITRMNMTYVLMGLVEHVKFLDIESPGRWAGFNDILVSNIASSIRQYGDRRIKSEQLQKVAITILEDSPVLYGIALLELVAPVHFPNIKVSTND